MRRKKKQTIICVYIFIQRQKVMSSDQVFRRAPILQNEMEKSQKIFVEFFYFYNTGLNFD
jgi:hypothetical protein